MDSLARSVEDRIERPAAGGAPGPDVRAVRSVVRASPTGRVGGGWTEGIHSS